MSTERRRLIPADNRSDYLSRFDYHGLEFLTLTYEAANPSFKSWEELTTLALDEWRAGRVSNAISEVYISR